MSHDHAMPPESGGGGRTEEPLWFRDWPQTIRSAMLGLWGLAFLLLVVSGHYQFYILPKLFWLPLLGGLFMLGMIWTRRQRHWVLHVHDEACINGEEPCWYRHRFRFAYLRPMAIFTLPLLLGMLVPPAGMNARGINIQPLEKSEALVQRLEMAHRRGPISMQFRHVEIKDAVKETAVGANLGQRVRVFGTVLVPPDPGKLPDRPDRWACVSQLVMNCCYADSYNVTLVLILPEGGKVDRQPRFDRTGRSDIKPVIKLPNGRQVMHGNPVMIVGTTDLIPWEGDTLVPALHVEKGGMAAIPELPSGLR